MCHNYRTYLYYDVNVFFYAQHKCVFGVDHVLFLDYIVSNQDLKVDSGEVEAIKSWPTPRSISEVRSFHGIVSFIVSSFIILVI